MKRACQRPLLRWCVCWAGILLLVGSVSAEPPRTDRLGDPLPEGAIARLGTMRLRHGSGITAVAFAPDGKTLASGDLSGGMRIWETATGRELHCFRGHSGQISAIAYSPDGKLLASAGANDGVFLWDPAKGCKLASLEEWSGAFQVTGCLAFAPDGKTLAGGVSSVAWWDVAARSRLRCLDGEHGNTISLAYAPDGKTLAYACYDHEIGLCDPATGKVIRTLREPQQKGKPDLLGMAYSPDGKNLLIADNSGCYSLDAASGKEVKRMDAVIPCSRPVFAPNGRFAAAMSVRGHPWVWDLKQNKDWEFEDFNGREQEAALAVSPDSKLLASGGSDGRIRLWDIAARKQVHFSDGEERGPRTFALCQFALSHNGRILAAQDDDYQLRLWNVADAKLAHVRPAPEHSLHYLVLSPDGSQLAVPGKDESDESTMQVLDAATGQKGWRANIGGMMWFAAYSPDGKLLATAASPLIRKRSPGVIYVSTSKVCDLYLLDAANGKTIGRLRGHAGRVATGLFSPDGKLLVTAGDDHTVRVWDVESKRERHRLTGHGGGATVSCLAFSADGSRLASGGDDARICIWDAAAGRRLHRWAIQKEERITCLALSADGKTLLANAGEGRFRLWDVAAGTAGPAIEGHRDAVTFAAFLPDGRTLLTASSDGTALVWDVATLRRHKPPAAATVRKDCYGDPLPPGVLARLGSIRLWHKDIIATTALSPDGTILAAASSDNEQGDLRFWDVRSGKELRRLSEEHALRLDHIAFSPDGKILAGMSDQTIHFWDVASGAYRGVAVRHEKSLSAFAFSADGTKIAAAGERVIGGTDFKVYLWDVNSGEQLHVFDGHQTSVRQIVFSADGKTVISASSGPGGGVVGGVRVWDVASRKQRHRYDDKGILAPNGQTVAFMQAGKVHVCAADTRRELWTAPTLGKLLVYSTNGRFLLAHAPKQPFRLWESATGKEVHRSEKVVEDRELPFSVCHLSADGTTVVTHNFSHIHLWNTKTGRERRPFAGHRSSVTCLSFAPDGRTLGSASVRGSVRIWEPATAKEVRVLREPAALVTALTYSPDGRRIACGDRNNVVQVWDAATGAEVGRFAGPKPKENSYYESVQCLAFSADGRTLAFGGSNGVLFVWEPATKKPPRQLATRSDAILALSFSVEGRLTALLTTKEPQGGSLLARQEIVVWDVATGRGPRRLNTWSEERPWSAAVSPDGQLLAVNPSVDGDIFSSGGAHIRLFETATGKEIERFLIRKGAGKLTFSPDNKILLAGGVLWDVARGQRIGKVGGSSEAISCSACSPNGRLIAVNGEDSTILLYPMPPAPRRDGTPPRPVSDAELQALWNDLTSPDAAVAWRAVHKLIAAPRHSVSFLHEMLRPCPPLDQRRLEPLLADLDSDAFAEREQARKELSKLGERAEPALRRTLDGKPSLEVRRQVLTLLEQIDTDATSADALRTRRVIAVLERIDTSAAVELLRRLAGGAAEARLTREAAAAVERQRLRCR